MKKIIFYTDTPIVGGAEKHMLQLAKNLDRQKYQITLVCSNYKQLNQWAETFSINNIDVKRVKTLHKHDPRQLLSLKKIFQEIKPDILHLHLWNPGACRYAFMANDEKVTKIISTEHDPFAINGLKKSFKKKCLKLTNHTISVSNANKELLIKLYPDLKGKISTIHNGIDLIDFEKQLLHFTNQERNKIKQKLFNAENGDIIITSIAALHPRKGLKYLIKAFSKVIIKKTDCKLIIIGEGPERKSLEKLIKNLDLFNKIMLLGYQENIPKILKTSQMFILPSIKEAFGLVLLEAMAAQLPIIASNVGGIPEIIQNHKNGELIESSNENALADKIIELLTNQALAQKLAFIGHHDVKNFDIKNMAKKTEEVYDNCI